MLQQHTNDNVLTALLTDLAANGVTDIVGSATRDWSDPIQPKPAPVKYAKATPTILPKPASPQPTPKAESKPVAIPLNPADFLFSHGNAGALLTILTAAMPEQADTLPFTAAEQRLLTNMLAALGYTMADTNLVAVIAVNEDGVPLTKTHIKEFHAAAKTELTTMQPQTILTFGQLAASVFLTGAAQPISACRKAQPRHQTCTTVTTYHPRLLLKSPQYKQLAWQDLQPLVKEQS